MRDNGEESSGSKRSMEVKGRDVQSGLPKVLDMTEDDITEAIQKPLKLIIDGVKEVLSQSPPELAADIVEKGIVLSGGSSMLKNLDKYITFYTGVPSFVVEEPLFCVIRGIGVAIDNMDQYKKAMR
jgi:rod shape-determining protein MreB